MRRSANRLKDCAIDRSPDGSDELLHGGVAAIARAALGDGPDADRERPVSRHDQARVLHAIVERRGRDALLAAGSHLDAAAGDPVLLALLNSDSPSVLLDKVDRLNRYLHSTHRHRLVELGDRHVELQHVSTRGPAPTADESTFVCGLYLALLDRIGCGGLTCAFPDAPTGSTDVYRGGRPREVPACGLGRWSIGWTSFRPVRTLTGLDELVLRQAPADLADGSASTRAGAVIAEDLSRAWKVADVAARLAMAPRTLQRRLADEGRSFTEVVRRTRVAAAEELLRDPGRSVTAIGFLTGFSDTAHFSRTFKAATGATPTRWRALAS